MQASAQLTVDTNGNIGIGDTLSSYDSQLSINGAGLNTSTVFVHANNQEYGVYSENIAPNAWLGINRTGVCGYATTSALATGIGRSIGVLGFASNAANGYNYGVFGVLGGLRQGGAVVGSVSKTLDYVSISGRYAGYFNGSVMATGTITASNFIVPSGAANVTNVSTLDSERSYQGIMSLTPVEYKNAYSLKLGPEVKDTISSDVLAELEASIAEKNASERPRFGFVAEDVQKIYPELVHEDAEGGLSVDYMGLIPLLIQTVQQLDAEVKTLKYAEEATKGCGSDFGTGSVENADIGKNVYISDNGTCEIEYALPDAVKNARLYIYSISGRLAESRTIEGRRNGKLSIDTSKLSKGIYLYTVIADGQSVTSRQMIVQ